MISPEEHEHEHIMIPAIDYRRPDNLSDYSIALLIDMISSQHERRGVAERRLQRIRKALYAAIDDPKSRTWDRVFQLKLWYDDAQESPPVQLWSLLVRHAGFAVTEHPVGDDWTVVPSGVQIVLALSEHFGPRNVIDPGEIF